MCRRSRRDLTGHKIDLEPGRTGKPQDMRYSRQVRRQTRYNGGQPLDGDVPAIVEVDALPDPRTDRELVAIRDAEIVQAAGRVRPYRNCRIIFDMTYLALMIFSPHSSSATRN